MTEVLPPQKTAADGVEFRRDGEDLVFAWPRWKLTARLARARERSDGVAGELHLRHDLAGDIFWGQVHLASAASRERIVAKIKRELPAGEGTPNWTHLIDVFALDATRAFRNDGAAFVRVGAMDDAIEAEEFLIGPLLLAGELNMIFAPSGTGKGYLAAALALQADARLAVLPLPIPKIATSVLYLDWEWSAEELNRRLQAICRGVKAPAHTILYRRMAGALADQADVLRREILKAGIKLIIIDSAQMACGEQDGGDPAAAFTRLVAVIRTFGVTSLLIDHPAKGAADETPYGTRYKLALCRNIWRARKSHGTERELHIGLWHDENSNVPPHPPLGLRLEFDRASWPNGRLQGLTFYREDPRDVEGFADMLTTWTRIEREILQRPMTVKELAEALDLGEMTIRARLNEKRKAGKADRLPDGRWAIIDRRNDA